jgi:hypothetical protein
VCLQLSFAKSDVKNKLYVGNLPRTITKEELLSILEQEVRGGFWCMYFADSTQGQRGIHSLT